MEIVSNFTVDAVNNYFKQKREKEEVEKDFNDSVLTNLVEKLYHMQGEVAIRKVISHCQAIENTEKGVAKHQGLLRDSVLEELKEKFHGPVKKVAIQKVNIFTYQTSNSLSLILDKFAGFHLKDRIQYILKECKQLLTREELKRELRKDQINREGYPMYM